MLPRKNFENLHAIMAILVLFEQFSRIFCFNFLTPILSASPNMMHFVRTFSIMRANGVRLIAIKEVSNYGKIVGYRPTSKTFLRTASGRMHSCIPLILTPGSALTISYRNHQKSLAYFRHLAPLILFFFS